ncbi:Serine/threonine protein kinase [Ancistrocladus abbreviatus]
MAFSGLFLLCLVFTAALFPIISLAADPYVSYELTFTYKTLSPLGVPQQVIVVNDEFPGPVINATTNYNAAVNVINKLDEDLLVNWLGIQMRHDSWQDGVRGTNCPIPSNWNFTYEFQVKDQIGSFFYFPSINFQRASGGYGPIIVNRRSIIPLPFDEPYGDIVIMIGDWYTRNHTALRTALDAGEDLGMPDGVLINGKGPYQYNSTLVPDGIEYETFTVEPGRTYRIRVHNVGISTSLNFRIQSHNMLLAEVEGHYTVQQNYTSFDIHVGQSYSFLVPMDQNASTDYYVVASARFVNESLWQRVTGVAILHYSNSKGKAAGPLPDPPNDLFDKSWSLNQAKSVRQNGSSSGARPNPQGSFHYGSINVTNVYLLQSLPPTAINGKLRATLNGISFVNPDTPIRLADMYKVKGDYKLDFPSQPLTGKPRLDRSIINGTFKGFAEIIFQNNDTVMQSFHMDGFSFYVVGMDYGLWTNDSRNQYNKWDAVSRCTVQVFPGGWTAVFVYLDNEGAWNIRTENLDRWYLGQETYIRLVNPEDNKITEYSAPENVLYCGALSYLQKQQQHYNLAVSSSQNFGLLFTLLMAVLAAGFNLY